MKRRHGHINKTLADPIRHSIIHTVYTDCKLNPYCLKFHNGMQTDRCKHCYPDTHVLSVEYLNRSKMLPFNCDRARSIDFITEE